MSENAKSTKALSAGQRRARVSRLVAAGKISKDAARLIDLREPSPGERAMAESLVAKGRQALTRKAAAKAA